MRRGTTSAVDRLDDQPAGPLALPTTRRRDPTDPSHTPSHKDGTIADTIRLEAHFRRKYRGAPEPSLPNRLEMGSERQPADHFTDIQVCSRGSVEDTATRRRMERSSRRRRGTGLFSNAIVLTIGSAHETVFSPRFWCRTSLLSPPLALTFIIHEGFMSTDSCSTSHRSQERVRSMGRLAESSRSM